ncbi:MAG: hypothetical protein GWN00_12780 [Aliifodinibius sp.]|nr:hypothetical protein [Fodinibius sp.]NIV12003.1 hypothetical protein [Fodinibius sp.]NIY25648.1 hypothetical protein [Fodinibius sp.]
MFKRLNIQHIHRVEDNLAWARELQKTVQQQANTGVISRLTESIALAAGRQHRLAIILLALSACRFSELKRIELSAIIDNRPQVIIQPKTGISRLVSEIYLTDGADTSTLDVTAPVLLQNYESLRIEMLRCIPSKVRTILKYQNDKTHIFRHIRASFKSWKGLSTSEISEYFAHQSEEATREYINTGLFEIFNQTQKGD